MRHRGAVGTKGLKLNCRKKEKCKFLFKRIFRTLPLVSSRLSLMVASYRTCSFLAKRVVISANSRFLSIISSRSLVISGPLKYFFDNRRCYKQWDYKQPRVGRVREKKDLGGTMPCEQNPENGVSFDNSIN